MLSLKESIRLSLVIRFRLVQDGFYWVTGRMDDVINVSGHRIGTAEVESALVAHGKVAEAAVVGFPHDVKGDFKVFKGLQRAQKA